MSFVKLATSSKDIVPVIITNLVPKSKTLFCQCSLLECRRKSPRPLDCYGGVTCSFGLRATRSRVPFAFNNNSKIGLVCTYYSAMDFDCDGRVEEYLTVCRQLKSKAVNPD